MASPWIPIPNPPTKFDSTLGAGYIACLVSTALSGVTCAQCMSFYQSYPNERKILKWSVAVLWALDTGHATLVAHAIYWFLVSHFDDPLVIGYVPWSIWASGIIAPTSELIVRFLFIYRVWILSQKKGWPTYPLVALTLASWAVAIAFVIEGQASATLADFESLHWMVYLNLSLLVAADFTVTASLLFYLRKGQTGFNKRMDSLLSTLIKYAANVGLITSVFALASFITFLAVPSTYVFSITYFPLSKLYTNAFLVTLNVRDRLRAEADHSNVSVAIVTSQQSIPIAFSTRAASDPTDLKGAVMQVESEVN